MLLLSNGWVMSCNQLEFINFRKCLKCTLAISYNTRSLASAGRYTCSSEFQWTRSFVSYMVIFLLGRYTPLIELQRTCSFVSCVVMFH
jgi:hypothetical protein